MIPYDESEKQYEALYGMIETRYDNFDFLMYGK